MRTKLRPAGCCEVPTQVDPLEESERRDVVEVFRALGDPTRLEIFRLIAAQPDLICVCDIVDRFNVSQPTISHHLRVLREARLVTVSRRGVWAYYGADPAGLRVAEATLSALAPEVAAMS